MGRHTARCLAGMLAGLLVVGLAGCTKGTPTTCKGWQRLLRSPVKGKAAIKSLGDLHCKESLAALEEVFPTSPYKDLILESVRQIHAPAESVSLLKKALADPEAAVQAATVAEDFAIADLRPALVEILTKDFAYPARENAPKALVKLDQANLKADEDLFIALLRDNPNKQGIAVNALAATQLGEIRSEKAVPLLIRSLFLRSSRGESIYVWVRKALARVGKPVVTPLLAVLTGDRNAAGSLLDEIGALAKSQGLYDWQWTDGPEMVQVAGDLGDPAAAPVLAASLAKPLSPPVGVDDRVTRTWQIAQQNRITMAMMGLWKVGTREIIPTLKDVIENPDNDAKQRLDTATALCLLPGFVGLDAALQIFGNSKAETFRAPMVKPLILGMDWARYPAWKARMKAEKSSLVKERFQGDSPEAQEYRSMARVLDQCQAGDVDCLIGFLQGEDVIAAEKAALLMTTLTGDAAAKAVKALLETYPKVDPGKAVDLRRFILLAVFRLGDRSAVPELKALRKADSERKGAGYWVDELDVQIAVMENR